uniref:SFRICE_026249 n=1 Tax=Spodoptera frugiperda TaxID=7108 RepID=A0A2H1VDE5_SPOFR
MANPIVVAKYAQKLPSLTDYDGRKAASQAWLSENVKFEYYLKKAELYEFTKKPPKNYSVDNLFASYGHEVLRLLPYNCDQNPIEYMWHLKKACKHQNLSQSAR